MNGLTRLFENAPEESIPTAIGHAFDGTSCDSSHKLEVLSCIAQAAKTLSALPPPSSSASLEPGESLKSAIAATSGKTRLFAPKALESQNRGIGRTGHRTRSALIGPDNRRPVIGFVIIPVRKNGRFIFLHRGVVYSFIRNVGLHRRMLLPDTRQRRQLL